MKMTNEEIATALFVAAMYFWYTNDKQMARDLIDTAIMVQAPLATMAMRHAICRSEIFTGILTSDTSRVKLS